MGIGISIYTVHSNSTHIRPEEFVGWACWALQWADFFFPEGKFPRYHFEAFLLISAARGEISPLDTYLKASCKPVGPFLIPTFIIAPFSSLHFKIQKGGLSSLITPLIDTHFQCTFTTSISTQ